MKGDQFLRILGFPKIDSLNLPQEDKDVVERVLQGVQDEARRVYGEIAKFREQHWTLYNKYKHGFTLIPYVQKASGNIDFLRDVESSIVVMHDAKAPIKNVITIPYSKKALEAYRILIAGIQELLISILENNRNIIENPNIPNLPMASKDLAQEERQRYETIVERLRPSKRVRRQHHIDVKVQAKKRIWHGMLI